MRSGLCMLEKFSAKSKVNPHLTRLYVIAERGGVAGVGSHALATIFGHLSLPLLAAGCYQLGGLPAMAAALLSQMGTTGRGEKLYARFLQR